MSGGLDNTESDERALADALPVICFSADPCGRLRWLNRRWDEYVGECPGQDAETRWRRASDRADDTPHQQGFASGEPFHWVERIRGRDGEAHLFLAQVQPQRDAGGTLTGWIGTCSKVTEQVESERLQAFLLKLGDLIREETDPERILAMTSEAVGLELAADRVVYGTVDWEGGIMLMSPDWRSDATVWAAHRFPLAAYSPEHIAAHTRGDTLAVSDVRIEPLVSDLARERFEAAGVVSFASVPLVKGGVARAIMTVQQFEPRQWSRFDLHLIAEAAERIWATLERAKSQAHLASAERRRVFLLAMSDRLRGESDPMQVLSLSAQALGEFLGVREVIFSEINEQGTHLCSLRSWSDGTVPPRQANIPLTALGDTLQRTYEAGLTKVSADIATDLDLPGSLRQALLDLGINAYVTVPVLSGGRLIGSLSVQSATAREWVEDDIELVEAVAERSWEALGRARAAVALRESEQLFRSVIEAHPIPVVIGQGGRLVLANPSFAALVHLGYGPAAPDTQAALAAAWEVVHPLVEGAEQGDDREASIALGTLVVPVSLSWRRIAYRGAPAVIVSIFDLTEAKRGQAELARSREALHQAEKLTALGSLLAGVSHELNNPLSIVTTQASLLEELVEGTPAADRAFKVRRAAERCSRIVQTFLAMARQKAPERREVRVGEVARAAFELVEYQLRTGGVETAFEVAPDLPPISADPDQLHQVLVNLLINAQQALQDRAGQRRMILRVARAGSDAIRIEVEDNGPGVPQDIRSRIFEPFFSTKPQGTGTGVGLSFSQGLVEAHGGRLDLFDGREGGACFRITLPILPIAIGEATGPSDSASPHSQNRGRLLVVDDEPELAEAIAIYAGRAGYQVDMAEDGASAIARLKSATYDLVLSDLRMPGLDGPGLYAWIAEEQPHLLGRLGFVTGDTMGQAADQFLERTGCPVIEKPFTGDGVRQLIERLHARRGVAA
ncbi:hybrid sensor histidine kinase/response regulator [Sphingomonas humi]